MSEVIFQRLRADDLPRIGEVDRSEVVEAEYRTRPSADGRSLGLERTPLDPPLEVGPWTAHGIDVRAREWKPHVEAGGVFLGALIGSRLVGFSIVAPPANGSSELAALFVDQRHRRTGLGTRLMRQSEEAAHELGAASMWLGSNRTASAVEFYLKHGFKAIRLSHGELTDRPPRDPIFAKTLLA